jgi:hypothetical protein
MKLKICREWISFVVLFLFAAAVSSPSLAQSMDVHSRSAAPFSESTAMLMFGLILVVTGGILHRRGKAANDRPV